MDHSFELAVALLGRCKRASISCIDSSKRGDIADSLRERGNFRGGLLTGSSVIFDVWIVDTLRLRLARLVILPTAGFSSFLTGGESGLSYIHHDGVSFRND